MTAKGPYQYLPYYWFVQSSLRCQLLDYGIWGRFGFSMLGGENSIILRTFF